MSRFRWHLVATLSALFFLAASCGDETVADDPINNGGSHSTECSAGQTFNPISGQCVSIGDNNPGNSNPGNSNPGNSNPGNSNPGNSNPGNSNPGNSNPGNSNPGEQLCGNGTIIGKTCSPDGAILAAATVTVSGQDCDGNYFELSTTTDGEGTYTLEDVPAGQHELVISSGSFSTSRFIGVSPGNTTDLRGEAQKVCLESNVPIAVIEGAYDNVGSILRSMELDFDVVGSDDTLGMGGWIPLPIPGISNATISDARNFLLNPQAMSQYKILFIECGTLFDDFGSQRDQAMTNLRNWVLQGNSLYASDWAHPFIEETFPNAVEFLDESQGISAARKGTGSQTVQADVISQEMLTLLSRDTAEVYLDLGAWVVATGADILSQVHFRSDVNTSSGNLSSVPLMISYNPPGSTGKVIYTSFHNGAQGSGMGSDMHDILRFMIFQL